MAKKNKNDLLKFGSLAGGFLLICSLLLNIFLFQKTQNTDKFYKVKEVIDGDTFVLEDDIIVRFYRIDAPEPDNCGGAEATAFLENLILGKSVSLDNKLRDSYGRLVSYVYLENGDLVNELILKEGWASYDEAKSELNDRLNKAEREARDQQKGIYNPKCRQLVNPDNPECSIKGNIAEGVKTYHFPGCGNYDSTVVELNHGDQWFCTEKEAEKAGFTRSKNCFDMKFESGV